MNSVSACNLHLNANVISPLLVRTLTSGFAFLTVLPLITPDSFVYAFLLDTSSVLCSPSWPVLKQNAFWWYVENFKFLVRKELPCFHWDYNTHQSWLRKWSPHRLIKFYLGRKAEISSFLYAMCLLNTQKNEEEWRTRSDEIMP